METEVRRRSESSSKTSKKAGGKHVKSVNAEDEARRREAVSERLREKLELDRRALQVVHRLLEDNVSEDFLLDCARFITSAYYKDAIEERSIAKLCGYPVCPNKLGKIPTQQFKISTKTNKVYDITERKCFCSNFCYKASKDFELQLSTTPLWLRQHESPPEIKLMKKGDGGSSGEEVRLSARRLQENDIENTLPAQHEDSHSSQQRSPASCLSHSDSSDGEQEQDFVSSVVPQRQGPRVHWGHLPKCTDEDEKGELGEVERRNKLNREKYEEEAQRQQSQKAEKEAEMGQGGDRRKSHACEKQIGTCAEKPKQHTMNINQPSGEQTLKKERELHEEASVEEVTANLDVCSLHTHSAALPVVPKLPQAADTTPPFTESNFPKDITSQVDLSGKTDGDSLTEPSPSQPGLDIIQVGMSKKGAAGLRDLLKNHTAGTKPNSIRLNLLECLRVTMKEWATDATLKFLRGSDHLSESAFTDVKEAREEEEELDEDDLDDEVSEEDRGEAVAGKQKTPSMAAPDYEMLRRETQELELRVREFYKGTMIQSQGVEENANKETDQDQNTKDPVLPLVDSHAPHLIQKRITVDKLTSCLRNIVGPLHLTLGDVIPDLNNLVRTFRFTNTNIIHKTPEWTLIAVVLLHLLSNVSPLVREALKTPASVEYLTTLMNELGLQEQDLLSLVQMF